MQVEMGAENGNVLLIKEGAQVYEEFEDWNTLGSGDQFIVQNAAEEKKAVVTPDGNLYLAGEVKECQLGPLEAQLAGTAFMVRNAAGTVVSLIDDQGNLKMLRTEEHVADPDMTGYLLVDGIPWNLKEHEATDHYFPY